MKKNGIALLLGVIVLTALFYRSSGIFRGLDSHYIIFHPDTPKQVIALSRYLRGHYYWQRGSLFYDGYPLALNHVDELFLRTMQAGYSVAGKDLDITRLSLVNLFRMTRQLRVFYGLLCLLLVFFLTRLLIRGPPWYLVTTSLFALAPVSIDVSHFASGDIGVDLFGAASLYCLALYPYRRKKRLIFCSAFFVGVAFSCKYNGMLVGIPVFFFLVLLCLKTWNISYCLCLIFLGSSLK